MSIEFDWAKYVDENSSASMQSADFSELPLAKLDWESSRDVELDHSREGLNLELSKVLKVEANSNCSRTSLKRSRCHSPDISMSNPKRTKIERVPVPPANSGAKSCLKKPPINFAEILKATKERQKKRQESFNVSSSVNLPKVTSAAEREEENGLRSSVEGAALIKRLRKKSCTNEETVAQPPQTSVCANLDTHRWVHSGKKMVATSCQTTKANERKTCLNCQFLKKLDSESGGNVAPIQTTSCQEPGHVIWQIKRKSGSTAANSRYPSDLMADKTTKTCLMIRDSESETNTPSISSVSSNRTQTQSNESMSMATSECDMNAVFAPSVSSPSSNVTPPEPEACFTQVIFEKPNLKGSSQFQYHAAQAAYSPPYSLRSEKVKNSSSTRKTKFTNARGEVIILTKHQVDMRLRQLSIGKQTWGYQNYIRAVSKQMRSSWHPKTPDAMERISKRRFNGKVNVWRRKLHFWDAPRSVGTTSEAHEARMEAMVTEEMAKYVDYENKEEHGVGRESWEIPENSRT